MADRESFELFVTECMGQITSVPNLRVSLRGQLRPLGEALYTWLRCTLTHEAELPPEIGFVPDTVPGNLEIGHHPGPPERIVFTHSLVFLLADMVARAAENSDLPPQLREQLLGLRHHGASTA